MRRILNIVLILGILLCFAGCESKNDVQNPAITVSSPETKATENVVEIPTQSSQEADDKTHSDEPNSALIENMPAAEARYKYDGENGPVIIEGDENSFRLYQVNIEDGEKTCIFSFKNTGNYRTSISLNPAYLPTLLREQLFSPDLTKLAVNWHDSVDNSEHVGWIDTEGVLTDVSNILHPNESSFASRVAKDSNSLFTPSGEFFFCDGNSGKYCYVDIDSVTVLREEDPIKDSYGFSLYEVNFLWGDKIVENLNTSGGNYQRFDMGDFNIDIFPANNGYYKFGCFDFCDQNDIVVGIMRDRDNGYKIGIYGNGYTEYDESKHLYTPDLHNLEYFSVTPDTDYVIESCAYRKGLIAFTAYRGEARSLFLTDASGQSNPISIADLGTEYRLFLWR